MVHVETVDLSTRGVSLPNDRVGMVIAQPHVPNAALSPEEPYQYTDQAKQQQLAMLTETMAVARAARHGSAKTHFTVFPEYSIPGVSRNLLLRSMLLRQRIAEDKFVFNVSIVDHVESSGWFKRPRTGGNGGQVRQGPHL